MAPSGSFTHGGWQAPFPDPAVGEFVIGSAGRLHHAVEGQEGLDGELHVDADAAMRRF